MNLEKQPESKVEEEIDSLDYIKKILRETRVRTEEEFKKNDIPGRDPKFKNSWLACFRTDLTSVHLFLTDLERQGRISEKSCEDITEQIFSLADYTKLLNEVYPTYKEIPPDSAKDQLFEKFEEIGKTILAAVKE